MDFSKSTKVIKIKFEDTLKRMKVNFNGGHTDLTMTDLRKKIHHTFQFPADDDFILTYVDEDGDVVTLFDDDDLSDALTQRMEGLKINVQLISNNKFGVASYAQSGGSSISTQRLTSLQTQHPYPKIETGVFAKVSKSVLQQLREALLRLLEFLKQYLNFYQKSCFEALSKIISKAVSDPDLDHLVHLISKICMNLLYKSILVLR